MRRGTRFAALLLLSGVFSKTAAADPLILPVSLPNGGAVPGPYTPAQAPPERPAIYDSGFGMGVHSGVADAGNIGSFVFGLEAERAWRWVAVGAEAEFLGVFNREYSNGYLQSASMAFAFAELRPYTPFYIAPFVRGALGFTSSSVVGRRDSETGTSLRVEAGLRIRFAPGFFRFYFSETTLPDGKFNAWSIALGLAEDRSPQ
jgi:hypothetical protein